MLDIINMIFPDGIIYALTLLFALLGIIKCVRPVLRNASHLRRAADMLEESAKANMPRPVWRDNLFLGRRLAPTWRTYLRNEELCRSRGLACDVGDFIHEDTIITEPGNASFADLVPGICTSLGILGTFVGLYMGLQGLDINEMDSYIRLTTGISIAFMTSIVGLICSLLFNVLNRLSIGRARRALDVFHKAFYQHGVPQPANAAMQLVAFEREQSDAMGGFAEDLSEHIAASLHAAIETTIAPLQRTMEDFMNVATRAQVDGIDYIVSRFVDKMDAALGGSFERLAQTVVQTAQGQDKVHQDMLYAVDAIAQVTQSVVSVHGVSEQMINRFADYVATIEQHYREIETAQVDSVGLLKQMRTASEQQTGYLHDLQAYQMQLTQSIAQYSDFQERLTASLDTRTAEQVDQLSVVAMEMRDGASMLSGSYKGFVKSVELGLASALGLFDENMQELTAQIQSTLSSISYTMENIEKSMRRVTPRSERQEVS